MTDCGFTSGQRVALRDASGAVFFIFSDHLSSARVITDATGTVCRDVDYFPYGGEKITLNTCPLLSYNFATYERDPESGLDYAIFRYYNSRLGRFMSPDILAGGVDDPQSLNRYAYVLNDPVNLIDPLGLINEGCTVFTVNKSNGDISTSIYCPLSRFITISVVDMLREMTIEFGGRLLGRNLREFINPPEPLPPPPPAPPLPLPPVAPCDARGSRDHGYNALDIKTGGKFGANVYATELGAVVGGSSGGSRSPYPGPPAPSGTTDFILLRTVSGKEVKYVHAAPSVPIGFFVEPGQRIGKTTETGRLSGPHLHLELFQGKASPGTQADPKPYLSSYCSF